jgi:hypothetical protein
MFSLAQKQEIAAEIEKLLLKFDHPEMPSEKPMFKLYVQGKESWSWANITPNWVFNADHEPDINPWNEMNDRKH